MIPKTVVLCTDIFDEFMDTNELYQIALSDIPDEEILRAFLQARLPERLIGDLEAYLDVVRQPSAPLPCSKMHITSLLPGYTPPI